MTLERYSHVMHLTSQVSGRAARRTRARSTCCGRRCRPGRSRARRRCGRWRSSTSSSRPSAAVYAGVVGYIDFSGNLDTAIAIRTMWSCARRAGQRAGGRGHRRRQRPHDEDEECAHKAGALLVAVAAARRMGAARRATDGTVSTLEAETEALRHGAGAYRAPRDVLAVGGPDAETYLQGQLQPGRGVAGGRASADSLLLEPDGKLSALRARDPPDGEELRPRRRRWVRRGRRSARLRRFLLRSKVEIETIPWRCLSLRGDAVADAAAGLLTVLAERGVLALPLAWNGWTGVDLLGPGDVVLEPQSADLPAGVMACGPDAVEACRIASGIPAMGTELDEQDDRGRSRTGRAHGELHQGLLHRPGTRGADRLTGLERGVPPGRRDRARGPVRARAPVPWHDAPRRRRPGGGRGSGRQGGGLRHVDRLEPRARRVGGPRLPASQCRCTRSRPRPIG